mmetsp:Transcript_8438/g.12877  ORF Transcript_8438/g.12877 Transcript_8438/m.12877 type:complete len:225 (-) Transcript_8438:47-721(-)
MSGSDEAFLRFYESYARSPIDELQMTPREPGDFRERVPRETIKGRYAVFHNSIETYLYRHWRAFTVPRMAVFALGGYTLTMHGIFMFTHTFPNLTSYKSFAHHPNYKLLGSAWSWFYALRPVFWTYITFRLTRAVYYMSKRHWQGFDDQHGTMYSDTLYPDLFHDSDDQRYINFRYSDQKVVPEPLTGYYPHSFLRYGKWLAKKEETFFKNPNPPEKDSLAPIV